MDIIIYQIDAFTNNLFQGNPAAVCPLSEPIDDRTMQSIAAENNLSETAFIFEKDGEKYIRWFTPTCEVDLCGHATLASAHVLFNHEGFTGDTLTFNSKSGKLHVSKNNDLLTLDFPATKLTHTPIDPLIEEALGKAPAETYAASDILAVFDSEEDIINFSPDFRALSQIKTRGVIVTAKGNDCDFVSRFFAPQVGIDEDPVTGSAHCLLAPFWADKLGKTTLSARQVSPRGGELECSINGDRVTISGRAVTYMKGVITI